MKNNYIIYKVENELNGMVYIGATTSTIDSRKTDHIQKACHGTGSYFNQEISTYGIEGFNWQEIDTACSTDELAQKEKQYIIEYNSKEEGLNSDSGGGFKKTIYQYDLEDGKLVGFYDCLENAGNAINATKKQISSICLSVNKAYKGFYWSYEHMDCFIPPKDKRKKQVIQFSLDGVKVAEFNSVAEASRQTGISKTCISRCCRGEREKSLGFKWRYI